MSNKNSSRDKDDHENDRALDRLREGGTLELSRQFIQLRPSIKVMLAKRLHGKLLSRLDASDIVQETFIRASKMLESYLDNPQIHPTIWLRILSKQILAEMVRNQYRQKRSLDLEQLSLDRDPIVDFLSDSFDSAGKQMQRAELVALVRKILDKVSVTDREILEMRHNDRLSFQEIGDLLEISMEAAKKRYYRAVERFRKFANTSEVLN